MRTSNNTHSVRAFRTGDERWRWQQAKRHRQVIGVALLLLMLLLIAVVVLPLSAPSPLLLPPPSKLSRYPSALNTNERHAEISVSSGGEGWSLELGRCSSCSPRSPDIPECDLKREK
ncbi:hypothetical protein O3P69_011487 [Scylla paramamosain]|uniref:Uncharacterized protein n=1 Tax=Scylla paramamosain TaxID=85552 RepID=A0AAW0T5X8_SCYPA